MAFAIAIVRYRRPFEEMLPFVEAHRAYLRRLHEEGVVIAGGPLEPGFGGAVLFRAATTIRRRCSIGFATRVRTWSPVWRSTRR